MGLVKFSTVTYGKWILSGEHAVLRGHPAVAFPLKARALHLSFSPGSHVLDVHFSGEHGEDYRLLFYGVLENAMNRLKVSEPLTGLFELRSTLPVGTGLGASAALCGAVARWCSVQGWIVEEQIYEFARSLEDLFHGESSGVDLAVSLSAKGIRFVRGVSRDEVTCKWSPQVFLSYCGQRGITSECVAKVKRLFETDRVFAEGLDLQMKKSVDLALDALLLTESDGFLRLKESLDLGHECFEKWGLCSGDLASHIRHLKEAGAVAAKPTGSGGGGYVLSLWSTKPPVSIAPLLISAGLAPAINLQAPR
jgi:mevalonate kinase